MMAIPLDAYRLDEIENSFEGLRAAVGWALFRYLHDYQPWRGRKHFRQVCARLHHEPQIAQYRWLNFRQPVNTFRFAHPFDRFVYWHVQYILKLGGYLNEND